MHRNRLLNLMMRNRAHGAGVRAEGSTVYLYDVIVDSIADEEWFGGVSAERIVQTLAAIDGPVTLRIDSPGGSVFGGRAIAQAVRTHAGGVTAIIDGLAASAASYVATSAGHVAMAPGAFMMIHRAWGITVGNAIDHMSQADLLDKIDGSIADSYVARAGGEQADWLARMDAETWMTAAEALALGLVDEAIPETRAAPPANRWDLTAFDHAPVTLTKPLADDPPEPVVVDVEDDRDIDAEIAARRRQLAVDLL